MEFNHLHQRALPVQLKGALQNLTHFDSVKLSHLNQVRLHFVRDDADTSHLEVDVAEFVCVVQEVVDEAPVTFVEEFQRLGNPVRDRVVEQVPP